MMIQTAPRVLLGGLVALLASPYLVVCFVSVGLFVLFGSITFALIKYVDFGQQSDPNSNNNNNQAAAIYANANLTSAKKQPVTGERRIN